MKRQELITLVSHNKGLKRIFHSIRYYPLWVIMKLGLRNPFFKLWGSRFVLKLPMRQDKLDVFNAFYDEIACI